LYKRVVRYCTDHKREQIFHPSMFWRMEIKPRQSGERVGELAPHFHLFFFGAPNIAYDTVIKWWQEITGDETIVFLNMKRLDNRRKGMNYVSKYVAKPSAADRALSASPNLDINLYLAAMGRFWGLEGGSDIPYARVVEVACTPLEASILRFIAVCEGMYPHLEFRRSAGFRLFVFENEGSRFKDILFECFWPDELASEEDTDFMSGS